MKSFRSIALVAVLALTAAPAMHAERTGCNPRPYAATTAVQAVLSYFGL